MAIADLVNGKITEPLSARALADGRACSRATCSPSPSATARSMVDLKFTDLPGTWQHMGMALAEPGRGGARRRDRLRRVVDPRLPGDLRVRHAAAARSRRRRSSTRSTRRRRSRSCARCSTRSRASRTRATRATWRSRRRSTCAPAASRTWLLRARGGVLRLRPRRLRPAGQHRVLRGRLRGGPLDLRPGVPATRRGTGRARLHEPLAGGLLPRPAERHPQRPARDDGDRPRGARHPHREPPPRGRRARARARSTCASSRCWRWPTPCSCTSTSSRTPPSRRASPRRSCPSRSSRRTAPACTSTSRCGRTARR